MLKQKHMLINMCPEMNGLWV